MLRVGNVMPWATNLKRKNCFSCSLTQLNLCKSTKNNAFDEVGKACILNVFVKPNEQCRACSDIVMARKRTFEERKKNNLHSIHNAQLPHKLNRHLPYSQPFQTANPSCFKSYFGKHCTPFTSTPALVGAKRVPHHAINHLKSNPHVSLSAY